MIKASEIVKTWDNHPVVEGYKIAPKGVSWVAQNSCIKLGNNVTIGESAKLSSNICIGDNVDIGHKVIIGAWTKIGNDVSIGGESLIGNDVKIEDFSVVGKSCNIGNFANLGKFVYISDEVTIGVCSNLSNLVRVGKGAVLQYRTVLGNCALVADNSSETIDLGFVDRSRISLSVIEDVAYIGATNRGYRTLQQAIAYWSLHSAEDNLVICLLESAKAIAKQRGWKFN